MSSFSPTTSGGGTKKRGREDDDGDSDDDKIQMEGEAARYGRYCRGARSVLHHPVGLPLLRALWRGGTSGGRSDDCKDDDCKDDDDEFPLIKELFPDFFEPRPPGEGVTATKASPGSPAGDNSKFDPVFREGHDAWDRRPPGGGGGAAATGEAALARVVADAMKGALLRAHDSTHFPVTTASEEDEPVLDYYMEELSHAAILVRRRVDRSGSDQEEDGVCDDAGDDKVDDDRTRPMLVAEVGLHPHVWWKKLNQGLTFLRHQKSFSNTRAALLAVVTVSCAVVEEEARASPTATAARLGVFLVTPVLVQYKHNPAVELRVSLLWHNRACYTERRPDAYLYSGVTGGETEVVCDIHTGRPKSDSDFGTYPKYSDTHVWLWKKDRDTSSRLLVIATPFREGRHYATSPRDFVPVVEHLERLHAVGYVHGDIRCFNMAMGPKGGLFDFDLVASFTKETEGLQEHSSIPTGTILLLETAPALGMPRSQLRSSTMSTL
jgi:hypothetical protein